MKGRSGAGGRVWAVAVVCAAALATALKVNLALRTYGTNDVLYWAWFLEQFQAVGGAGLYHATDPANGSKFFNHPPFMIHGLQLIAALTTASDGRFAFWLRLPAILADLGSILLVWRLLAPRLGTSVSPAGLALLAVAPASIMISGFHGNTDPVMVFFALLAVYLLDRRRPAWLAGLALGMALSIKVVPVIFLPAIVLSLPDMRRRTGFLAATGATFLIGSLPYIAQDPVFITRRVFGYGSFSGHWGVSRLLTGLLPDGAWPIAAYAGYGRFAVLAALVAASWWMNAPPRKPPLFLQCGLLAFLFLALIPGFGVQYLAWLVPWVAALGLRVAVPFHAASGLFLFLVYTYWSRGLPWYLADSVSVGLWRGPVIAVEILCWATVVATVLVYIRRLRADSARPSAARAKCQSPGVVGGRYG